MKNVIELTKELISIPSWVDGNTNEAKIGEYIYDYLVKNSDLQVQKQEVEGGRFNIFASKGKQTDMLIVGHIDTVQPSLNWTCDPTTPTETEGKLVGLGTSDMKSGIAIMLSLATNSKLKTNTSFLFYIDEEYDFLGMRAFIEEYKDRINPKMVVSLDGSDETIGNGCRGLIEIACTINGKAGHAARPKSGNNAIVGSMTIIQQLFSWIDGYNDPVLGKSSFNLAYLKGGQNQGTLDGELVLGKQGNVIADVCEFIIDIRPSVKELTAEKVIKFIDESAKELNLTLSGSNIRHNLGSWLTLKTSLPNLNLPVGDASQTGYIDLQMLWKTFKQVPCMTIGAGESAMAHKADEYVRPNQLLQLLEIMEKWMFTE